MAHDGALHVTLPSGYKYHGKSSVGEPLFAYDLQAVQEETDALLYCVCIEDIPNDDLEGDCAIYGEMDPDDGTSSITVKATYVQYVAL